MKNSPSSFAGQFRLAIRKQLLVPTIALIGVLLLIGVSIQIRSVKAFAGISLTTLGTPYTQSFDSLIPSSSATWTNDSTIAGWFHARTGTGTTIVANDGSSNAGNLYSYGTGTATDRAIGSVGSGNAAVGNLFWGVRLQNNTGATINSLDVSYTGEQWRNSAAAAQTIAFSYLVGSPTVTGSLAEFQSAGVAVPSLDFTSPITGGAAGALNGNLAANRVTITFSITGLSIPNGTEVMLRWSDPDHTGADHGLSIDDFSVTPQGAVPATALNISDVTMAEGNPSGTTTFTFAVTLTAPAGPGGVTFDIATADGTAQDDNPATEDNDYVAQSLTGQSIPMGSTGPYNFSVTVNRDTTTEPNETFFVNVTNIVGANPGDVQGQGTINNDDVTVVPIHDIQGNGAATPIPGATVTTTGIVTLLKTSSNAGGGAASGFFLQTPDTDVDADPNTSEGIFVFTSSVPTYTSPATPVAVGDELTVTGTVVEFNGMTEISPTTNLTFIDAGNPLPAAITLSAADLPSNALPTQPQLEKFEGMRLSATALLAVVPNDSFFDVETVLSPVPRQQVFREPGIPFSDPVPPDPTSGLVDPNIPIWDENPERLKIDTNGRAGSPNNPYTSNVTFSNVTGPLDFAFGEYRLTPEAALTASPNMSAAPIPLPNANEYTIAGYNIENFNNNATQRQKVSLTFRTILHYPDIVGHVEIFDLADLQALRDQINNDAVAAGDPNPQYEAYLIEADGTSEDNDQDVAFLVKTSRVSVTSVTQELEEETFVEPGGGTAILHDRPPLVLDAIIDPSGANPQRVLVVVNHTRSFIDIELVTGDGPRVREKRKKQAESIAQLLQNLQTANPTTPVIAVGDYNAYQFSDGYTDPISVLKGTPTPDDQIVVDASPDVVNPNFINIIEDVPADQRYSFIFEGTPQLIDHVLVNTVAHANYTRITIAHNNPDFPESPAAAFASNAARPEANSDHDIPVAYFQLPNPCVITCPANITVANDTDQCGAIVTYANPTTTGDCGTVTCSPASGSFFPVGTTTVTCTDQPGGGTKASPAGGTGSCSFTVTVNDTQAPTIVCPANITRTEQKPGQGAVVTYADPTVMDNCPGATFSCAPVSGSTFPVGTTTVTCTATDTATPTANMATCTFTVTVNAGSNCVLTCPANISVSNDAKQCGATVNYPAPTTTGDCGTVTCSPASGSQFPVGTTTVTCTSSKKVTCTFTVTVNNTQPAITCPANISVSNDAKQCGATVNYPAPVLNPCSKAMVVCAPASGSLFAIGTTTVTCTATDETRTQTCTFTITVNDTQAPTITCPTNKTVTTANPTLTTAVVTYTAPTVSDNCPGATVVCSPASGSTFPLGTTTVTCTATDASGNTASCSFTVTVFNICLQDDTNSSTVVLVNTQTGDYRFCCVGSVFKGKGSVTVSGGNYVIQHNTVDRRVLIKLSTSTNSGTASLQTPVGTNRCAITDRDTRNNTCNCQ